MVYSVAYACGLFLSIPIIFYFIIFRYVLTDQVDLFISASIMWGGCGIGRGDGFCPKGHGIHFRSSHHVGTLASPSLTVACGSSAWNSGTASVLCRDRL